jgi:hypothetical protein
VHPRRQQAHARADVPCTQRQSSSLRTGRGKRTGIRDYAGGAAVRRHVGERLHAVTCGVRVGTVVGGRECGSAEWPMCLHGRARARPAKKSALGSTAVPGLALPQRAGESAHRGCLAECVEQQRERAVVRSAVHGKDLA